MDPATAKRLVELNHTFYQECAASFSRTRRTLQPGIIKAFATIRPTGTLLDLGCGNARVAAHLEELEGKVESYVGVDHSRPLMEAEWEPGRRVRLLEEDLAVPGWGNRLTAGGELPPIDHVLCLAVLHHIPDREARARLLEEIAGLLPPGGMLVLSVWQVLHLPRLVAKVRPWSLIGVDADLLEPGDLLMTWGEGERHLRYVHQCDRADLVDLCRRVGLECRERYRSDGETGDLSLYLICRKI